VVVLSQLSSAGAAKFHHWFLQEQREEVSSMWDLLNILLAEDYLARNPDQGEAANAPPAAGGAI
jgi:hypothetical protein